MNAAPDRKPGPDTSLWAKPAPDEARPGRHRLLKAEAYLPARAEPPEMGWQHLAFRLGVRGVKPGGREHRHRIWTRFIRRPLHGPKIIAVFSPKGGVGKSTTTIELGQTLARVRGDLVAALDANPDSGNLVKRLPEPYSPRSADDLARAAGTLGRYTDLLPYVTQDDSGLSVIRSSDNSWQRLGPDEYRQVLGALSRFYSIILVDLGTGMREPAFLSIVNMADAVIAVTEPSFDSAEVAIAGIDWLRGQIPGKVGAGTLVLNAVEPRYTRIDTGRLAAEFGKRMVSVLEVPRDPHLAMGGVPLWPLLARHTQDAYLALAAHVIDGLPNEEQPGQAAREKAAGLAGRPGRVIRENEPGGAVAPARSA